MLATIEIFAIDKIKSNFFIDDSILLFLRNEKPTFKFFRKFLDQYQADSVSIGLAKQNSNCERNQVNEGAIAGNYKCTIIDETKKPASGCAKHIEDEEVLWKNNGPILELPNSKSCWDKDDAYGESGEAFDDNQSKKKNCAGSSYGDIGYTISHREDPKLFEVERKQRPNCKTMECETDINQGMILGRVEKFGPAIPLDDCELGYF